jgi:hypothetical protein
LRRYNTALHLACEGGQVGCVRAILSFGLGSGAAYGTVNNEGLTPQAVAERGHKGALPLLEEFREFLNLASAAPKADIYAHIVGRETYTQSGRERRESASLKGDEAKEFAVTVSSYMAGRRGARAAHTISAVIRVSY